MLSSYLKSSDLADLVNILTSPLSKHTKLSKSCTRSSGPILCSFIKPATLALYFSTISLSIMGYWVKKIRFTSC